MLHALILLGILAAAITAVLLHELLAAAVGLSLTSALLAVLFYEMGASTAAVFELSVGAGLTAVLFIAAISLTKSGRESPITQPGVLGILSVIVNFSVVGLIFFHAARTILANPPVRGALQAGSAAASLWNARPLDVLLQGVVLFASVLGIILLFRTEERR